MPHNFDPYAHLAPEEKKKLKDPPGSKHKLPRHEVRGGKVYREGMTDPIDKAALEVNRTRHSRRVAEIDRQIAKLQADRQRHLDQAAHLDDVINRSS